MPTLTPSQRVFGVGLSPIQKAFRPPEDQENSYEYNDYARRQWANQDRLDAERGAVKLALEQQRALREKLAMESETRQVERDAMDAMAADPENSGDILQSYPTLAYSKNLRDIIAYNDAVKESRNPASKAQTTITNALRPRLQPHEIDFFNESLKANPDPLAAWDYAKNTDTA